MDTNVDVSLIAGEGDSAPLLLSIGYGSGHVVIQIESREKVEEIAAYIARHKNAQGTQWTEVGRFGSYPVTLSIASDVIAFIVDSDLSLGSFGQSAGIYIPVDLSGHLVCRLLLEKKKKHLIKYKLKLRFKCV